MQIDNFDFCKNPHFKFTKLESKIQNITVSENSKRSFLEGKPKQGYIGIAELPCAHEAPTITVHLIPAFNKKDGLLRLNNQNKKFNGLVVESTQKLGQFTGDLHTFAASALGLGHKAGINGLLLGLGIWKTGIGLKFLEDRPSKRAWVTNEYHFVLDKQENRWEIFYIGDELESWIIHPEIRFKSNKELIGLINSLPLVSPEELDTNLRLKIEYHLRVDSSSGSVIGFAKHRSSSQNMFSIKYSDEYKQYCAKEKEDPNNPYHPIAREIPLKIFSLILNTIQVAFGKEKIDDYTENLIIPYGPRQNLIREKNWIRKQKLLYNEKKRIVCNAINYATNAKSNQYEYRTLNEIFMRQIQGRHLQIASICHYAIEIENEDILNTSLNYCKSIEELNTKNHIGNTPLEQAEINELPNMANRIRAKMIHLLPNHYLFINDIPSPHNLVHYSYAYPRGAHLVEQPSFVYQTQISQLTKKLDMALSAYQTKLILSKDLMASWCECLNRYLSMQEQPIPGLNDRDLVWDTLTNVYYALFKDNNIRTAIYTELQKHSLHYSVSPPYERW